MPSSTKTTLITGGSSGIGLGMATRFVAAGHRVLLVSDRPEELEAASATLRERTPGAQVHTLQQDLTEPDAPAAVHAWSRDIGQVDVLVNNAGFGTFGFLHTIPVQRERAMIALNVGAVYALTRLFLDDMVQRDAGTLIQISSNSSFQPVPKMATYAATKAFVTHLGRALHEELRMQGSAVRVITVCPAAISDTAFRTVNDMERVQTFRGLAATTTAEVVGDVWHAYAGRRDFVVTGFKQRLLMWLRPFLPYGVVMALVRREVREH